MPNVFSPNRDQALWNCARECGLRRIRKSCRNEYGSYACNSCSLDIRQYGNFSPQDAQLYMMQANSAAQELQDINIRCNLFFVFIAAIALILGGVYIKNYIITLRQYSSSPQESLNIAPSKHEQIESILRKVRLSMLEKADINNDGLSNCIDAAVTFYKLYPERNNVRIIVNKHPDGRMHHLFNAVYTDGDWLHIEPQAMYMHYNFYSMPFVWKNTYNPLYNKDATEEYRKYAK